MYKPEESTETFDHDDSNDDVENLKKSDIDELTWKDEEGKS